MPVSKFHDLLHAFRPDPNFPGGRQVLDRMVGAPKFVFTEDVIFFISDHVEEYADAMMLAATAGHSELAHNPMVVEYGALEPAGMRAFWLIDGGPLYFRAWYATNGHPSLRGNPIVLDGHFPCRIGPGGGRTHVHVDAYVGAVTDEQNQPMIDGLRGEARNAIFMAQALHVRGIILLPPRPAAAKLDRARAKRGQPPVTRDFVTVHIGYVTDRDGNRHDYVEGAGHHVRVHLRRGHIRNQPCGPGLIDRKEVWIPPVLVNYRPGATIDEADYLVVP